MDKNYRSSRSYFTRLLSFILIFLLSPENLTAKMAVYMDTSRPIKERVDNILSQMTLEEKIAQMDMVSGREFANAGIIDKSYAEINIGQLGVGSIHDFYPSTSELANDLQRYIIEHNRLGIPALFIEETLHGYVQPGSTVFPVPLALASSWNPALVQEVGSAIATEARSKGTHVGLSPVLGIIRDPRWGRVEETFGEDTYLASIMGAKMVKGFQGKDLTDQNTIASVVKHFAVHSVPLSGTNSSPAYMGKREALQYFLPVFNAAINNGGASGVMTAYSEWNGIPCTGDSWLLRTILRERWNYKGFTIADMGAIRMLSTCHFTTESSSASLKKAINAGVEMQFYDFPSDVFIEEVKKLVESGEIPKEYIDQAASHILHLKFELGLFDHPYTDPSLSSEMVHCDTHKDLALKAARESIVLLKNDGMLPLSKDIKKLAVIGPAVNSDYPGGYSTKRSKAKTLKQGLQEIAENHLEIRYADGVSFINEGVPIPSDQLFTIDEKKSGLNASYYSNADLEGKPNLKRVDDSVDFYWDTHSPAAEVSPDSFSVCWEGWLIPSEDVHGWIGVSSDDGSRLWFNDRLVIDTWDTGVNIRRFNVDLIAGEKYKIKMEFREILWGASASLRWSKNAENIPEAVELAQWADAVIIAGGENDLLIGENRDRLSLELSGNQSVLIREIAKIGKPVALVLINGRPIALSDDVGNVNAILECWFGGENAGRAIADILFGDYNPSGKLPVTFPKYTGQIPCNYNRTPSKIMRYSDGDAKPQFCFGHGLSYTTFKYSNLRLEKKSLSPADEMTFTLDVKNIGDRDGNTVVQVYINDIFSSVTTPIKELKAFKRVELKKDEVQTVTFTIPIEKLSLFDENLEEKVEPGKFELMIGESSEDIRLRTTFEVH